MLDDIAISATGIGKMYSVASGMLPHYLTLRETLTNSVKQFLVSLFAKSGAIGRETGSKDKNEFWALRDVSFEVKRGEIFGIIGRNGAGKSTLLKVLSRITHPTTGCVKIRGRVASLLEVGTGFHPELTGRENIYLNGSILGMSRTEIDRVFDDIVAFAEIGEFVNLPVKHYSSGMYVRLAFAVAAHLDPDILILDEVLAVGDAGFQRKCAAKIDEIARSGDRTIILVSHGMSNITSMCHRAMLLDEGRLVEIASPASVVAKYLAMNTAAKSAVDYSAAPIGDDLAVLIGGSVENDQKKCEGSIDIAEAFRVKMIYKLRADLSTSPVANFHFRDSLGNVAFISAGRCASGASGIYEAICHVPSRLMNNDSYSVDLALTHIGPSGVQVSFYEKAALVFIVTETERELFETRYGYEGPIPGAVRPKLNWNFNRLQS